MFVAKLLDRVIMRRRSVSTGTRVPTRWYNVVSLSELGSSAYGDPSTIEAKLLTINKP